MLLSERSQSEKATYWMIPTTFHSGKGKTRDTEKSQCFPGVEVGGSMNKRIQRIAGQGN
jgi:hypothetical protein